MTAEMATIDLSKLGRVTLYNAFRNSKKFHRLVENGALKGVFAPIDHWNRIKGDGMSTDPQSRDPAKMETFLDIDSEVPMQENCIGFICGHDGWGAVKSTKEPGRPFYGVIVAAKQWPTIEQQLVAVVA